MGEFLPGFEELGTPDFQSHGPFIYEYDRNSNSEALEEEGLRDQGSWLQDARSGMHSLLTFG